MSAATLPNHRAAVQETRFPMFEKLFVTAVCWRNQCAALICALVLLPVRLVSAWRLNCLQARAARERAFVMRVAQQIEDLRRRRS